METLWTVDFSQEATEDYDNIIAYTKEHFGLGQALSYGHIIGNAVMELSEYGPSHPLANKRPELGTHVQSLGIRRQGKNARHILFFRARQIAGTPTITVLRILHDSAEFSHHL